MPDNNDLMDFLLDDVEESRAAQRHKRVWKVMIVDDDPAVHEATKFSLLRFSFLGKEISWLSAYSAKEARRLLEQDRDIALLFLDVVMEEDDAGLTFAKWFREENINPSTRIILRTGQPGQAPERQIIVDYDLHDYKTKTELTADKLFTTTVSALRAYHDMHRLEETRKGLEGIVHATATIFKVQTMYEYAKAVLRQIESILDIRSSGIMCVQSQEDGEWEVVAESGTFERSQGEIVALLNESSRQGGAGGDESYMVRMLLESDRYRYAIYIEPNDSLNDIQLRMLLMFCNNVSVGIANIQLYNSLINANRVTVMSLAHVTESRDHSTGEHVFRIANAAELLVRELMSRGLYPDELTEQTVRFLGLSSTLHDIGKVMISDKILLKPGKLTTDEFDEIKTHTLRGANVLESVIRSSGEQVKYLEMGKEIALYHHERWDGTGYPHRLSGRQIPIEARITSIVDVFDALTHQRCYKPAYTIAEASRIINEGRGTMFDPVITDVFLDILDEIVAVVPDIDLGAQT